ncbi:HAMP domain-containing histidine kinase [Kroppenstedtia pulmonis]|uniref:histidine kinase n=1 Tax=Kroppenstedtia pulmonis TaxID=1380685 RepID=A0A7D4BG77_9BACL|nr:HAMP domain-containing sensor histidine kinase [Kroppenstedtia pulmonis]QKG83355.1 HAMP domain-containing histidine kinase [Kroppenstedtia pulmonis]
MGLNARITLRFLLWLGIYLIMMGLVAVGSLTFYSVSQFGEPYGKKHPYSGDVLRETVRHTQWKDNVIVVEEEQKKKLQKLGGWLQILDEEGKEKYRLDAPSYLPHRYAPGELADLKSTTENVYSWYGEKDGRKLTWIYGSTHLLERLTSQATISGTNIDVPKALLEQVRREKGWIQVLNEQGEEIYQYRKPKSIPRQYSSGELSYYLSFAHKEDLSLKYWYDRRKERNWTWIYGTPPIDNQLMEEFWKKATTSFYIGWGLVAVIMAFLFGRRLGAPLLHMLNWLQNLDRGVYQEPVNRKGIPRSQMAGKKGLRRPYRIYRDVVQTMERLTQTLQRAEKERSRLEKTREEWITGVSHDMKTPLASVKGYADLLATSEYKWSDEEVRQFAKVVQDKSAYMERMLNDLSLTYRLKNESLPLHLTSCNLTELLRRSAIDVANDPIFSQQNITFQGPESKVVYPLDPHWFKRAVDNLVINAAQHNPAGTTIQVCLRERMSETPHTSAGLVIDIIDNGKGMDQESLEHLFDRYYRGTDTDRKEEGSGLGMIIAKQLIEAHGGRIEIHSQSGEGTTVSIFLPPISQS